MSDALEEMIDAILFGEDFGRALTTGEQVTVANFKNLMAEYASRKMVQLRYDAAQSRKEVDRLTEKGAVLEFVDVWPAQYPEH